VKGATEAVVTDLTLNAMKKSARRLAGRYVKKPNREETSAMVAR